MKNELSPRQQNYVAGVVAGQSRFQAAKSAGYSDAMAKNASVQIERPAVKLALRDALEAAGVTPELIAQRVKEGLDATMVLRATKFADREEPPDYSERRQMTELAAKMRGDLDTGLTINLNQILAHIPEEFAEDMAITPEDCLDMVMDADGMLVSNGDADSLDVSPGGNRGRINGKDIAAGIEEE